MKGFWLLQQTNDFANRFIHIFISFDAKRDEVLPSIKLIKEFDFILDCRTMNVFTS